MIADINFGVDVIIALKVPDTQGGDHACFNYDYSKAIVVETSVHGTVIASEHADMVHGNFSTFRDGGRFIASFYLSQSIVDHCWARHDDAC